MVDFIYGIKGSNTSNSKVIHTDFNFASGLLCGLFTGVIIVPYVKRMVNDKKSKYQALKNQEQLLRKTLKELLDSVCSFDENGNVKEEDLDENEQLVKPRALSPALCKDINSLLNQKIDTIEEGVEEEEEEEEDHDNINTLRTVTRSPWHFVSYFYKKNV